MKVVAQWKITKTTHWVWPCNFDSLNRRTLHWILHSNKLFNHRQVIFTRATLISIDVSLSILSTKLLTCNGGNKLTVMIKHCPLSSRPIRQCFRALTLTPKCLIPSFSYIYGWPLVNTGKNNKIGKPWAAKGWLRSLSKGSHLSKKTITMFVLNVGKIGTLKTGCSIQLKKKKNKKNKN